MTASPEYKQPLDLAQPRRPAGVTVIAILCWLLGALDLLVGVLLLVTRSSSELSPVALIGIGVLGLVYIAAGLGLFNGVDVARVVVLLGSLVSFASGLHAAGNGQLVFGILTVLITVAIAILLWTGRASDWFAGDAQR